jgi:RHS repeat-associated protein
MHFSGHNGIAETTRSVALAATLWAAVCLPSTAIAQGDDKNGVSPQSVQLPSGAGTVRGEDADGFEFDAATGTATYSIPFEVTPGPVGLQPDVGLSYESGGGNGIVGFGWSLGAAAGPDVDSIQRRTSKLLPRYIDGPNGIDDDADGTVDEPDEVDSFVAEGGKILVPLADGYYLGQKESTWTRYSRHCLSVDAEGAPEGEPEGTPEGDVEGEPDPCAAKSALSRKHRKFSGAKATASPVYPDDAGEYACADAPVQEDGSPCADGWDGEYSDGGGARFGQTENSRIVHPDTGEIFTWLLDEEYDTTGNEVLYYYTSFDDERNLNQKYLQTIEYVNYSTYAEDLCRGVYPWSQFQFIVFIYEDREDMFETTEGGFPIRTGKRLREVIMGTQGVELAGHLEGDFNGDGVADYLNRRYELEYQPGHWSLLTKVTQFGMDSVSSLPPMSMTYLDCAPPETVSAAGAIVGSLNTPLLVMDNSAVEITELNGDGLPDILRTEAAGGFHTAYLNQGEVDAPGGGKAIQWSAPTGIGGDTRVYQINLQEGAGSAAYLADMDADGMSDLVHDPDEVYWYQLRKGADGPEWGPRTLMNVDADTTYPPSPFSTSGTSYEDLNGDERTDIIQSILVGGQAYFRMWYNLGGELYSGSLVIAGENALALSEDGTSLEDFNGDGLPDLVRVVATGIEVSPGLGYAHFATRRRVNLPDFTLNLNQAQSASLEDLNGDDLPELVIERAGPGELWYWINLGDYRFDTKRTITGLPTPTGESAAVRWADLNGNGTTDIIYADKFSQPTIRYVDIGKLIGCGPAPHLLSTINTGIGQITTFTYASSTDYQLADAAAGRIWTDPMPMPTVVLASRSNDDTFGAIYTTRYVYHDGFYKYEADYDFFAGFAEVEEIEEGGEGAPTVVHRLKFDVGRDDPARRGNLIGESMEDDQGRVFWQETTEYSLDQNFTGVDGRPVQWVAPSRRVRDILELGVGTPRRTEIEYDYDEYGNEILEANYGLVEGDDRAAFNDEAITRRVFTWNCLDWLISYVAREEIFDYDGTPISRTETYYDQESFTNDLFRFTLYGGETQILQWPDLVNSPDTLISTARFQYDISGNIGTTTDGLAVADEEGTLDPEAGHYRVEDYEDLFQTYIEQETHYVGNGQAPLVAQYEYDYGTGNLLLYRNFNGSETQYRYDVFGRLIAILRPGDSEDFPTMEFEYGVGLPFGDGTLSYVETRHLDTPPNTEGLSKRDHYAISRSYVDGLGRELLSKVEAEPDPVTGAPRVIVKGAGNWSPRGNVAQEFLPYFSQLPGVTLDDILAYEDIADPDWRALYYIEGQPQIFPIDTVPSTFYKFDALLREIESVLADGNLAFNRYEPQRLVWFDVLTNDPESIRFELPMEYDYDAAGRILTTKEFTRELDDGTPVQDPVAWITRYDYRADGKLERITDAQENQHLFTFDGLGRMIQENDPDRGVSTMAYDDASNLVEVVDAKLQRTTYTYDGVNRPLTEDYHDEGLPFSYNFTYDPAEPISETNRPDVVYYYDTPQTAPQGDGTEADTAFGAGVLTRALDVTGEYFYSYTERGNEAWIVSVLPDPYTQAPTAYRAAMDYDALDRLIQITYPDGDTAGYSYNARGLLAAITGGAPLNAGGTPILLEVPDYGPSGEVQLARYGNGMEARRLFDIRRRMIRSFVAAPATPDAPIIDYTYQFNAGSDLLSKKDARPESVRPSGDPLRNTQYFDYDAVQRLTRYDVVLDASNPLPDGSNRISYRFDRIGNLLEQRATMAPGPDAAPVELGTLSYGGSLGASNRTGRTTEDPGPHALTAYTTEAGTENLAYDANGNLTGHGGFTFTYDFADRMVQAEGPGVRARYAYNHDDQRVLKEVWTQNDDGTETFDAAKSAQYLGQYYEIRAHGQPVKFVFSDELRVAQITGSLQADAVRTQRLRLYAGWNLASIAVDAPDAAAQLLAAGGAVLEAYQIDPATGASEVLAADSPLPAGAAVWIHASENATLSLNGAYAPPAGLAVPQSGFVALPSFDAVRTATIPETAEQIWAYDAATQSWQIRLAGDLTFLSDLPPFIAPGQTIYLSLAEPAAVALPAPAAKIRYYHVDHLGSTCVVTDGAGALVEETAYFPYGEPRARAVFTEEGADVPYAYTQKERDKETGLQYFTARYLSGPLARFTSVDPILQEPGQKILEDPQLLNAYAYTANNPVAYVDLYGEDRTRANQILNKLNPYGGIGGPRKAALVAKKRREIFKQFKIEAGGSLPDFGANDNLFKRKKVQTEVAKLKKEKGFDLDNFLPLNRKLNQLNTLTVAKDGKQVNFDNKQIREFLFGKDSIGAATSKKNTKLTTEASKQITRLNDTLKTLDLNAEFDKLKKVAEKSLEKTAFKPDEKQVSDIAGLIDSPARNYGL